MSATLDERLARQEKLLRAIDAAQRDEDSNARVCTTFLDDLAPTT